MKKMYEKVLEVIKNSNYEIFGIRHIASDESYKVGDYARNSYDWGNDDNEVIIEDAEVLYIF